MSDNLFLSKIEEYSKREVGFKKAMVDYFQEEGQAIVDSLNSSNSNTLKALDSFAVKVSTLRGKISEAANNVLTVSSISGNSNSQFFLSDFKIINSENVIIDGNTLTLASEIKDRHQIFSVDVYTNGQLGNSADYDEKRYYDKSLITTNKHLEIESFTSGVSATISIDLKSTRVVNLIEFGYKEFGLNAPTVGRIELSKNGSDFREVDKTILTGADKISISFEDSEVQVIRFNIAQSDGYIAKNSRTRFPIGIYGLSVGVSSAVETGSATFGPMSSFREIIKASIGCNIPNDGYSIVNSVFEISHDAETWTEISAPYVINDKLKVVDYNTIANNAISTPSAVKSLYLKVTLVGEKITKNYSYNSAYNKHTQTVSSGNPSIYLPFDMGQDSIVGINTGASFGDRVTSTVWTDSISAIDNIESIRVEDNYQIKTMSGMGTKNKVTVKYPLVKCGIEKSDNYKIIPLRTSDVYSSKFYRSSEPIKRKVRVSSSANIVLPFAQPAGIYTLTDGKIYRKIDLSSGFFTSSYQWAYQPHELQVSLISPIGEELHIFEAGKEISLLDYFTVEYPASSDDSPVSVTFNKEFPHKELSHSEFSIVNGQILSGSENAIVEAYTAYMKEITVESEFGVDNIVFATPDVSLVRTSEKLSKYDGKNIAKLNKTGILRGSIKFDYSSASIFSFVEEVDFINGIDEFNTGNKVEVQIPASATQFSLGALVDHFSDIKFIGYTSIFSNRVFSEEELISPGDYMLKDISKSETVIILPEGVRTHDIINTKAIIDIPIDSVGNGYFSVDYNNGIIYSQTKIDGNTSISYISSNIYMSGKEMNYMSRSEYNVNGRDLQFNSVSDDTSITVVSKISEIYKLDIYKSPVIKDLTLNTVVA